MSEKPRLVAICTCPAGERSWWPAESLTERCPDCGECEPEFFVPALSQEQREQLREMAREIDNGLALNDGHAALLRNILAGGGE